MTDLFVLRDFVVRVGLIVLGGLAVWLVWCLS